MSDTIIWITGATEGIGLGLARNAPYADARIVNLSRRRHPDYESVQVDLSDPASWAAVRRHLAGELAAFRGSRAIFIHNAYASDAVGLVGKVPSDVYERAVIANSAAPLVLGEAFISACPPGLDAGLVLLSSGAAVAPLEGLAAYCAAKISVEHWAEVVSRERASRGGTGPWVVAVRPGGVDTAPVRALAAWDVERYPRAASVARNIGNRVDIDTAARRIWAELPPDPRIAVISFADTPASPEFRFGGERIRQVPSANWKLVYDAD